MGMGYGGAGPGPYPAAGGQPTSLGMPQGAAAQGGGRGVALLAPLSGDNAARGQALQQAAQLALGTPPVVPLDVKDTGGTPAGAAAAAQAAIAGGAGMILGPLTSGETAAVSGPARAANVPVLAFTNDQSRAQPGVWVLGITPAQQVGRLVGAVTADGKTRFAAVLPDNEFGQAMAAALVQAVSAANLAQPNVRTYSGGMSAINQAMRDISDYADRRGPIDAQIREARSHLDAEGRKRAAELAKQPIPPAPFDALLLGDTGNALAEVAAVLPYYDINASQVQILGPALWGSSGTGGGQIVGAWYAAPDPSARDAFAQAYQAKYGAPPPPLADLAFDAAAIARVLAGQGYTAGNLTQPNGFSGVDGWLALQPDGEVRRGLAVFQIQSGGGAQMVAPAPASPTATGA